MAPSVFISSTSEDLKKHRQQAARAARALGFRPLMMEDFAADGSDRSLGACLKKVEEADVVVAIVGHKYGWVPESDDSRSITWRECAHAWDVTKKEVLGFIVAPNADWPTTDFENYRLVTERRKPGIVDEVERNETQLEVFKKKLREKFCSFFTDDQDLRALVIAALSEWQNRHPQSAPLMAPGDQEGYLFALLSDTSQIRVTKLKTKRAEPYFFGIDEIYIPLTTTVGRERWLEQRRTALERELAHPRVVIIGEPGAGKSTFLKRITFELCRNILDLNPKEVAPFLPAGDKRFPMLVRVADLATILAADRSPHPLDSPDWLPYFLGLQSTIYRWGVDESFFRRKLEAGGCLVMVDGLDEAPDRLLRERVSRIFERATLAYKHNHFLVTTRPQYYEGDAVLKDFTNARIGELEVAEIKAFFAHFAEALALPTNEALRFQEALESALATRSEIAEIARNPVMLTALAVLQHNDQRLPEYRVELYESILGWLASAREVKDGRPAAERCLEYLRKLALAMQYAPKGRLVQINRREAAELAAKQFGGTIEENWRLLERETQDSGIIVAVGEDLKFWHLSFQEYLAAREIASLSDEQQFTTVVKNDRLYDPQWREMMRLLGGVLRQQGIQKVEGLVGSILDELDKKPEQRVQGAALLSGMLSDLKGMGYEPPNPKYGQAVKAVMGIFEVGTAEGIGIKTRIELAELLGQGGDPRLDQDNWVAIPPGAFWMGSQTEIDHKNYDPAADSIESPVHQVRLAAFKVGKYPVTVQEFGRFLKKDGYDNQEYWSAGEFGRFKEPHNWREQQLFLNRPVVGVSWYEACAYCAWKGGRLPTEAEWERVGRGADNLRFPWGEGPPLSPDRSNFGENVGSPTPVGIYLGGQTLEGVCDVLGNVWEWCSDWFEEYTNEMRVNPSGPLSGHSKILRGGSWVDDPGFVRVSYRLILEPSNRFSGIGFRCAMT